MPRLGELLVAANVISSTQLEQALRAQVVWGGRLGTNLIELGFIDLDELSRQLGKQHNLPAALARHFERADPELQQQLPATLADKHSLVPLLRLAEGQIALAGMDPLDPKGYAEIAGALCVAPTALVMSIAAEQRMRYQLERVYGIRRSARYLRSRGGSIPPFPQFGDFSEEADSEVEIPIDVEGEDLDIPIEQEIPGDDDPTIAIPRADTDALAAAIEQAAANATLETEPSGRERRAYIKTIDEGAVPRGQHERKREPSRPRKQLGRIAIKKMTRTGSPTGMGMAAASEERDTDSLADIAKAIRRSPDRDRVAELVIEGLVKHAPCCEAAMLFVIRGGTATSWKYFSRSGADQPELAVPMTQPGLVPQAADFGTTQRKRVGELTELDAKLVAELAPARAEGAESACEELAVVPIAIHGRVMCVLALACNDGEITPVETIATSAGTAFARLMRDAGR
ncbi:MAG: hypothetical protein QM831_05490 [Kofleriaceae bacterium]